MENTEMEKNTTAEKENANAAANANMAKLFDPEEQIRQFASGKMELCVPIQDGQETYKQLHWDFLALTGAEYVDAMDRDRSANNTFRITNTQALNLFAVAAAKATKGLDATDILRGIGIMDSQKAAQIATVFFTASNRAGNRRISNE